MVWAYCTQEIEARTRTNGELASDFSCTISTIPISHHSTLQLNIRVSIETLEEGVGFWPDIFGCVGHSAVYLMLFQPLYVI